MGAGASSSQSHPRAFTPNEPQASDIRMTFWPCGPTRSRSRSSGCWYQIPSMFTFRSVIRPSCPETVRVAG
jgi:hypothetical protein